MVEYSLYTEGNRRKMQEACLRGGAGSLLYSPAPPDPPPRSSSIFHTRKDQCDKEKIPEHSALQQNIPLLSAVQQSI